MKIEYVLSCDDYVEYYLYIHRITQERRRKSRWYWPFVILPSIFCIPVAYPLFFIIFQAMLFSLPPDAPHGDRICGGMAGFATLLFSMIFFVRPWNWEQRRLIRARVRGYQRKGQIHVGYPCELELSDEGIALTIRQKWTQQGGDYTYRLDYRKVWSQVWAIDLLERHAFVLTKDSGCFFIPESAFASSLSFLEFVETARRLWAAGPSTAITASVPLGAVRTGIQRRPRP